jgi:hypothetical protein
MRTIQVTIRLGNASRKFTGKQGRVVVGKGAGCDLVLPFKHLQDEHLIAESLGNAIRVRAASPEARAVVLGRELGIEWRVVPSPTRVEIAGPDGKPVVLEFARIEPGLSALFLCESSDTTNHGEPGAFDDADAEMATGSLGGATSFGLAQPGPAPGGPGSFDDSSGSDGASFGPFSSNLAVAGLAVIFVLLIGGALGLNRYRHALVRNAIAADEHFVAGKIAAVSELIRKKDYSGARAALDAADPVAHRQPTLAASVTEIDRLRQKPEVQLGANGYELIDGQWVAPALAQAIHTAHERDDPRIAQLEKQAADQLAARHYDAARAACEEALGIMANYPVKPHPRQAPVEAELASIKAESVTAEMTAKGLVRYENEWVTPDEKFRREQKAKGLVEYEGSWMTPEQVAEAEKKGGSGLVFYNGKWMTPDEKMQAQGYVQFEGQWVKPEEKAATLAKRKAEEEAAKLEQAKAEALKKVAYAKSQDFIRKQVAPSAKTTFRALDGDKVTVIWDDGWYIVRGALSISDGGAAPSEKTYFCKLRPKPDSATEWEAETTVFAN